MEVCCSGYKAVTTQTKSLFQVCQSERIIYIQKCVLIYQIGNSNTF